MKNPWYQNLLWKNTVWYQNLLWRNSVWYRNLWVVCPLLVTPSAKRNTYSVAPPFIYSTQGRGAAHLNPGLGKRNSYRVARGAYLPQWANYTWSLGADHQHWANIILTLVVLYSGLERKTWANLLILSPSIGTLVTICNQIAVIMWESVRFVEFISYTL